MSMHEMTYLIRYRPSEAKERIVAALRKAGMHRGRAAEILGCRRESVTMWIDRLGMTGAVAALEKRAVREGWYDVSPGGRPKGAKDREPGTRSRPDVAERNTRRKSETGLPARAGKPRKTA